MALKDLNLGFCRKNTDTGVQNLASLMSLTKISLRCRSEVSDEGARYLGNMKALKNL